MKTLYQSLLLVIGALALAGTAFAQVPSSNDTSDAVYNTGMGTGSLGGPADSPRGSYNTASGYYTLYLNTANANTAIGYEALLHNTTGADNTASGYSALHTNYIGSNNTASGFDALYSNSTGNNNTAVGNSALYRNETGL
jgi:hypothetical protein